MNNIDIKTINYLNLMAKNNTAIKCSKGGLVITPSQGIYSPTTLNKIDRISRFLSTQTDSVKNRESLKFLKNKLIRDALGNNTLISKVKDLALQKGEGPAPSISIAEQTKPFEVIKLGIIFESDDLLTNRVAVIHARNLLMHKVPLIVNREFLVAHRDIFYEFQIPCECFHQKNGNLSVIIPVELENLAKFGFNEKEFIKGSFTKIPKLKKTEIPNDLDKILLKEDSEKKFYRVDFRFGHGTPANDESEGFIGGLPTKTYLLTQGVLKQKGVKCEILESCFAGGGNLKAIQQTPYPVFLASSSESLTLANSLFPSYDGIIEYVTKGIREGNLKLDQTLLRDEKINQILSGHDISTAPQIILPLNEPIEITSHSKEHKTFKRLQKSIHKESINLEENNGFVSSGGTKNHILKEVIASKNDLTSIAKSTVSLLYLPDSPVKKGIFISKIECKNKPSDWLSSNFNHVMIYASNEENLFLFSKPNLFSNQEYFYCYLDSLNPEFIQINEDFALCFYYKNFAKSIQTRKEEGESLILEFQKSFFEKIDNPLHQIYSTLVKSHLYDHGSEKRKEYFQEFQKQIKGSFTKSNLVNIHQFAIDLKLPFFANLVEAALAPELIQRIWQENEDATLLFLKQKLQKYDDSDLFVRDVQNKTALYWALHSNQMNLLDFMLNEITRIWKTSQPHSIDNSAIVEACHLGNTKILDRILQAYCIKLQDLDSKTFLEALEAALKSNNLDMAEHLLHGRQDFSEILSAVPYLLVQYANTDLLKSFLNNFKNDIPYSLSNALSLSISKKDITLAKILLENRARPHTSLLVLCSKPQSSDQLPIFELLIKNEANVDFIDENGYSPLFLALKNKNFPLIEALMKAGASPNLLHKDSNKTAFQLAMCEESLMKALLKNCSLQQLEKDIPLQLFHPLFLALKAQDFQLADRLIEKGIKCNMNDLMLEYLIATKNQAQISVIQWIFQHGSNWQNLWVNDLKQEAILYCSLDMIHSIENLLFVTESADYPIDEGIEQLGNAIVGYGSTIREMENWEGAVLESDKLASFETYSGPLKVREDVLRYYIRETKKFEKNSQLLDLLIDTGNTELYQLLLNAMIDKCKIEAFKPLYQALQKGDLSQVKTIMINFTKEDIALMWEYLPPPFLLKVLEKPAKELVQEVLKQMAFAKLPQMKQEDRIPILLMMMTLCHDDFAMKCQVASYATMEEAWEYLKMQLL